VYNVATFDNISLILVSKTLATCEVIRSYIVSSNQTHRILQQSTDKQKMEDQAFLFKIVLIGNAGVGKTCLVRQFTQGKFPTRQGATIGVDFLIKPLTVKGELLDFFVY